MNAEEKETDVKKNFEKFIIDLRANLAKCKYRKVLEEIVAKGIIFNQLELSWKITELKLRSMMKIVCKKLKKEKDTNNSNAYVKSIEGWFGRIEDEIDSWANDIVIRESFQNYEQLDLLIQFVLEAIYLMALHFKKEKKFCEASAVLASGERVIKVFMDFSKNPKTINLAAKIMLFLSSLLMGDNDHETAKGYQASCLKLSFREIFLKTDVMDGLNYNSLSSIEQHQFNKVFVHIILAFYQRGVCEENLGQIAKSIDAYKQSKWFAIKFVKTDLPELAQFVNDVENRAVSYHDLIKLLKEKKEDKVSGGLFRTRERNNTQSSLQGEGKSQTGEVENELNKFEKTKMFIESLNFPELEYEANRNEKQKNTNMMLSTVHLVENLMSEEFKDILKNMKDLEVNVMSKEMQERLQKRINELRGERHFQKMNQNNKNEKSEKSEKSGIMSKIKSAKLINSAKLKSASTIMHNRNSNSDLLNSQNFTTTFRKENTLPVNKHPVLQNSPSTSNKTGILTPHMSRVKSARSVLPFNSSYTRKPRHSPVEKLSYDAYVFDKTYRNKLDYLNRLNKREIRFQKQLLALKKYEKIFVEEIDQVKVKEEADIFFRRTLIDAVSKLSYSESQGQKGDFMKNMYSKDGRSRDNLENKVIMSLDPKQLQKLKQIWKNELKPNLEIREEFLKKINNNKTENLGNLVYLNKKNHEVENELDNKLEQLDKQNLYYERLLSPSKSSKRSAHSAKGFSSNKSMTVKNMDYFVKSPEKEKEIKYTKTIKKMAKVK